MVAPQRPALQTLRRGPKCSHQMCCTPGVLNCTPDHEFRTFKQMSCQKERLTATCGSSSASGEQQHRHKNVWMQLYWADIVESYHRGRLATQERVRSAVTDVLPPGVLNCTPDHEFQNFQAECLV
jgi:hypothetical protein